jgi:acyl-CoA synthetase (AMP-forming)/AMP-acid ligase II
MMGPSSFIRLFAQYGSGAPFPSLRHVSTGGENVPRSVIDQMHALFPAARTYIAYGTTEAGGRISAISTRDPHFGDGCCGVPFPHWEVRVAPVDGVAAPGGELYLRGPTVFLGYLQEDGTYAGLDEEGFLHTGDLVRPDPDGCLYHLGRVGKLLKVGGFMVNPSEVEQALVALPGVAEALCWVEPHDLLGNAIVAQVVPASGTELDERTLRREMQSRLEPHKVPRAIAIVDALPEAPSGKRLLKPAGPHVAE